MDQEDALVEPSPSAVPAVVATFSGGGLAIAGMYWQHWAAELGACACLLLAWRLTRPADVEGAADHPMSRRSTRLLLLAFAILTGVAGTVRLVRGG